MSHQATELAQGFFAGAQWQYREVDLALPLVDRIETCRTLPAECVEYLLGVWSALRNWYQPLS